MLHELIFAEVTITSITVYGLMLLLVKALIILLLAQTLSDQFEYSPASIRHAIWLIALVSLAALPLLMTMLPVWRLFSVDIPAAVIAATNTTPLVESATVAAAPVLSTADGLIILYAIVAIGRLAYLSMEVIKVGLVTMSAKQAGAEWYQEVQQYASGRVQIKVTAALDGPVTWGVLSPVILLPENCQRWSQLEREMVLRHELGHIQRSDWLAQLMGQLVAILYWPVPGISKALRALSLEAERACDDTVLADGVTPADYAALLLRQAKVNKLQATVALGKPSELAERVRHIVNAYVDRAGERKACFWLAVGAGVFMLPFASIQAIGSLPQSGPLAGMLLIPVVISPVEQKSVVTDINTANINRPIKPELITLPPKTPTFKPRVAIDKLSFDDASMQSVTVSSEADMDIPALNTSKATVRLRQQPEYPSVARRRGIEGRVVVEFDIDTDGYVINPRVTEAEPSDLFNRSVLNAIQGYRYEPYRLQGQAMGLQGLKEEFRFQLIEEKPIKRVSSGESQAATKHTIDSS